MAVAFENVDCPIEGLLDPGRSWDLHVAREYPRGVELLGDVQRLRERVEAILEAVTPPVVRVKLERVDVKVRRDDEGLAHSGGVQI